MKWSEHLIARAVALQIFQRKHLVVVDNCNWTGHECDLLVVTSDLRIIDVEVKISRADFKADAKKDKWWHRRFTGYGPVVEEHRDGRLVRMSQKPLYDETERLWPPKVWKHYYALPKAIWKPEMVEFINPNSGILLLREGRASMPVIVDVERRVRANKDAEKITAAQAVDIARLASLRMWAAYSDVARMRDDTARILAARQPEEATA